MHKKYKKILAVSSGNLKLQETFCQSFVADHHSHIAVVRRLLFHCCLQQGKYQRPWLPNSNGPRAASATTPPVLAPQWFLSPKLIQHNMGTFCADSLCVNPAHVQPLARKLHLEAVVLQRSCGNAILTLLATATCRMKSHNAGCLGPATSNTLRT